MVVFSKTMEVGSSSTSSTADKAFPAGLRVLVVDDDPLSLKVMEMMLKKSLYEVVARRDGLSALSVLREKKGGFDLVITDVHMPGMDGFELLDHIEKEFKIPVIMMSRKDELNVVTRGLERGACFFLLKPVNENDIQNIWQHAFRRKREELLEMEETGSVIREPYSVPPSNKTTRSWTRSMTRSRNKGVVIQELNESASSSVNEANSSRLSERERERGKRKARENDDEGGGSGSGSGSGSGGGEGDGGDDGENGNGRRGAQKKARVVWNTDLHNQFLDAIDRLGIEKAVPKKILEIMSVPGLTRENVASHLQKYRLFVKKLMEATQSEEPSTAMSLASGALKSSFANGHSASSLLSNIQQRGLLSESSTPQRPALTSSAYQPAGSSSSLFGTSNNNFQGLTSNINNHSNNLRISQVGSSAGASSSRWFNRHAGPSSSNGYNSSSSAAANNLQYGLPSLTMSNNQVAGMGAHQQPWLGSSSSALSLYNQPNVNSTTGRYPGLSSSGFGMDRQTNYSLRTNGSYYGSSSTSRDNTLTVNIHQQNPLALGRPRNFGTGPLEHNLNIWNQLQGQLNNTMGAGNLGGSGLSSSYGNTNFSQTPHYNGTTSTNNSYTGGIQMGNNNLGSSVEIGGTNQNVGGLFFRESSANRSNNVNWNYSNLVMTNENLLSRNAAGKMPIHQEGQAEGSPSSTSSPPDQTFGLMLNSGYSTQNSDEEVAAAGGGSFGGGFTDVNNNQLSSSMFIPNNVITSEQESSPPVPVSQPGEEATAEQNEGEFNEIFNLLRSNSTAADELNSLPQLFDEGDLGDFLFKQFDDRGAANQQPCGDEVVDPNFDISAYEVDDDM